VQRAIHGSGGVFEWIPVAFLSLFMIVGVMPLGLGLFILAGRVRLVATRERLIITEIAGPFRWTRKLPFSDIDRMEVGTRKDAGIQAPPGAGTRLMQLSALVAVMKRGQKKLIALGYPSDWLSPLAAELSYASRREGPAVPVQEVSMTPSPSVQTPQQEESL